MKSLRILSGAARLLLGVGLLLAGARPASAFEFWDGRVNVSGFYEMQTRLLNPDFRHEWDLGQWRHILNIEAEANLVDDPWGFLDRVSAYSRVEISYDCVWTRGCGIFRSADAYGNRIGRFPSVYIDGNRNGFVGADPNVNPVNPISDYHQTPDVNDIAESPADLGVDGRFLPFTTPRRSTSQLVGIGDVPPFEILGPNTSFNSTFKPFLGYEFAVMQDTVTSSGGDSSGIDAIVLMPRPKDDVDNIGSLRGIPNQTVFEFENAFLASSTLADGLPYRGRVEGLFNPSPGLTELREDEDISRFDQNFGQNDLAWDLGASQDEWQLREAYLDFEFFDSRLFVRLGKQTIVWGKTELFRNQDRFNPSDLAITTLPNLEESRIPQWALRAIYSLYDVGPFQDVRLELAWRIDDFEPNDLGRCGEPFTPLPVCVKTFGLFQHGILGVGLAGESRPPDWWDSIRGHELGARVEWRWGRFSFAVTDFWYWDRQADPRIFQQYVRNVDPATGRPRESDSNGSCTTGTEAACLTSDEALEKSALNRQVFDVVCSSSIGFFSLDERVCALTITNSLLLAGTGVDSDDPVRDTPLSALISATAAGNANAALLIGTLAGSTPPVTALNMDLNDGVGGSLAPILLAAPDPVQLGNSLTDEQQALVGCGAFWDDGRTFTGADFGDVTSLSDCDVFGVNLLLTEGSVLFGAWTGNVGPVATRFVNGQQITLPGARGLLEDRLTLDPDYDPMVDGCFTDDTGLLGFGAAAGLAADCAGQNVLTDPTGFEFRSEVEALSFNALNFVVALDLGNLSAVPGSPGVGEDCDPTVPAECFFPEFLGDHPGITLSDGRVDTDGRGPLFCPTVQDFFSVTGTTRPELRAGGNGRFGRRDFAWAGAGEVVLEYQKLNTLGFAMDFSEDFTLTSWGVELTWTNDKIFADSEQADLQSHSDIFALTVSMDRPTFINFLNANRTFFFNMQWFLEYIPGYEGEGPDGRHRGFEVEGPWTALGVFTVTTGLYQDRLTPRGTLVYDVKSESGAAIFSMAYRFSAAASMSIGINHFFGDGRAWTIPAGFGAVGESNQTHRTERFTRLNAVRERDEVFATLRYTF